MVEFLKKINSNINKALDVLITEKTTEMINTINTSITNKSVIKSVQRGVTSVSGNITISSVNINKTLVISTSKGSFGYVASRGVLSSFNVPTNSGYAPYNDSNNAMWGEHAINLTSSASPSISGGTTDLTTKQYSAKLVNSTTLSCDGAVEWQVIEFY